MIKIENKGCKCEVCNSYNQTAMWFDLAKYNNKVYPISAEVNYIEEIDAFDIDPIVRKAENMIGEDSKNEDIFLLSMDESFFTKEDIKLSNVGIENIGAVCNGCKSFL